jgi:hypothetical protein
VADSLAQANEVWRNMASVSKIAQTRERYANYRAEMDRNVANSLEAISNLIYLIRHSLYDPAKALSYVELAEERLKALAKHTVICPNCAAQPEEMNKRWTSQQEHLWPVTGTSIG